MTGVNDLTMTLGDAAAFLGKYKIEQNEACNYEITYEIVGNPSFVIHQKNQRRFKVHP